MDHRKKQKTKNMRYYCVFAYIISKQRYMMCFVFLLNSILELCNIYLVALGNKQYDVFRHFVLLMRNQMEHECVFFAKLNLNY